jgi:hypothetical protein
MCRHTVASERLSGLLISSPAPLLAAVVVISLPGALFRGAENGDIAVWFQWRNLDVALVEFMVMMPLVMTLKVSAGKTM